MAATESLYASKIIKAGALLSDTKILLAHWDESANTRIAPAPLPTSAFTGIMFLLQKHQPTGASLIVPPDRRLFFLSPESVEQFLFANQGILFA